ncbi:MAG: NADH-quinone oxidoreductase subunit C [Fimbriiglobus sp.]
MTTLELLQAKFPDGGYSSAEYLDNKRLLIAADKTDALLHPVLKALKDHGFDMLCDIGGIDYLNYPNATDRYSVVYALTNTKTGERLFVKAYANDPEPELPSVVDLWKGADWMEREVYDMFGVRFPGHPDMRRILLPSEFTSYPLRKDYPLRGYGERHNFEVVTRAES